MKDRIRPKGNRSPRPSTPDSPGRRIGTGTAGLIIELGLNADQLSLTYVRGLSIAQAIKCKNCRLTEGVFSDKCTDICDRARKLDILRSRMESHLE